MSDSRVVYSTDGRRKQDLRDAAGVRPLAQRSGSKGNAGPHAPDDGIVRIFRERGGRGGKVVTVVRGLRARDAALEALAGELKRLCGAGGAVKDRAIEVQGDHRERIAERLRALGHTVKLAGG